MMEYSWPGNVRELQNCVRRAVILAGDKQIRAGHLFQPSQRIEPFSARNEARPAHVQAGQDTGEAPLVNRLRLAVMQPLSDIEREVIEAVIAECDGSLTRAAQVLQVSPSTLYRKRESWAALDVPAAESKDAPAEGALPVRLASSNG